MTASSDFLAPAPGQPLRRALMRGVLRFLFRGRVCPPTPIARQRQLVERLTRTPAPRGVRVETRPLAGRPCEWLVPESSRGLLLYLHGGAYVLGSPATHRGLCASLARRARMAVCVLDYRLAPEHPYPAAREDAVAAYRALLELGHRPQEIVIAGDSAGGNLCLSSVLALKEQGLPLPAALVCLSPWADLSGTRMHQPPAGDPMLHPDWLRQAVELFCPPGMDRCDPGLSPLYGKLAGLPPLLIQVGEDELLLNDSLRLAERARAAGVAVRLERYPGLWHVFQANVGRLAAADQAVARIIAFIHEQQEQRV
ncbi:putative acetyl-hydrolase LipR [compost metagenome]